MVNVRETYLGILYIFDHIYRSLIPHVSISASGVVTHDGLMYVVGGDDGTSNLSSVEMYNPKTDTWTLLKAAMGIGRSYTGVCVIEKPESF